MTYTKYIYLHKMEYFNILFYSIIPHIITISYMLITLRPLFFKVPDFTDKKLEEGIKNKFEYLLTKDNITKNIQFRIKKHSQFCSAKGINLFSPCIFIPPKLEYINRHILSFIIKHELSHIKNNDCFFIPLLGLLTNICLRLLFDNNQFFNSNIIIKFFIHILPLLAIILLSRHQEKKADDYAIMHSTKEELEAAIIFFKALRSLNPYSYLSDLVHPSLNQRISKIEQILYDTNIEKKKYDVEKMVKINDIRNLIIDVVSNN